MESSFRRRTSLGPRLRGDDRIYIVGPNCHGTNSLCPYPCSSLLLFFPDAVSRIIWKKRSPTSDTVVEPSTISPQLMSMSSSWRFHSALFVASYSDGDGAQPYAEPRPVVKQIMLAPPATCPVAETGS